MKNKARGIVDDQKAGNESNGIITLIDNVVRLNETKCSAEIHLSRTVTDIDARYARISLNKIPREPRLVTRKKKKKAAKKVAFFHYGNYGPVFKYFVEQCMGCEWIPIPHAQSKRSLELGSLYSNDFVCAPFKHMLGDYIQVLEEGADVIVQFTGFCRLTYYGELQESILRDLGYEFEILNFSTLAGASPKEYAQTIKQINPKLSIRKAISGLIGCAKMAEDVDEVYDYYLAHAGLACDPSLFRNAFTRYLAKLDEATNDKHITAAKQEVLRCMRAIPQRSDNSPVRIGLVGEFYTAVDQGSNLCLEDKCIAMGAQLYKTVNISNRFLAYREPALRTKVSEYLRYDAGPTSTMTIEAAKRYALEGLDGIIHIKSSGCTPEIDCMPVLQRVSEDYHIPILYLSFDSQTSDTGLDTRLEAFYDMLAMKKEKEHK